MITRRRSARAVRRPGPRSIRARLPGQCRPCPDRAASSHPPAPSADRRSKQGPVTSWVEAPYAAGSHGKSVARTGDIRGRARRPARGRIDLHEPAVERPTGRLCECRENGTTEREDVPSVSAVQRNGRNHLVGRGIDPHDLGSARIAPVKAQFADPSTATSATCPSLRRIVSTTRFVEGSIRTMPPPDSSEPATHTLLCATTSPPPPISHPGTTGVGIVATILSLCGSMRRIERSGWPAGSRATHTLPAPYATDVARPTSIVSVTRAVSGGVVAAVDEVGPSAAARSIRVTVCCQFGTQMESVLGS